MKQEYENASFNFKKQFNIYIIFMYSGGHYYNNFLR